MTDLKSYDHSEQAISPDDLHLSEKHGEERLQMQSEIAEGRIKEISVNASTGGLDEFFNENLSSRSIDPWGWSRLVTRRVFDVVDRSAAEYQSSSRSSSAAILESQILSYTANDVLAQIQNIRAGGIHSLQTLETLKGFTVSAMEEANAQREEMVRRQAETIKNRGWWSKAGHKALTIGTLGAYHLVRTEKRQEWFNSALEKSMTKRFDRINKNIERLESRVGKRIAPTQAHIRRTLAAAADPDEKAALQSDLITALRKDSGNLASVDLSVHWGITDPQEKINFLEAAQGLDFVKKDLGIVGISRAKQMQQDEMIASAREQQDILKDTTDFEFENIKSRPGFKDLLTEGATVPSISDLVQKIENELASDSTINLEDIYSSGTLNINKANLLTDSVKLILLVKKIHTIDADKKLQVSTRQSLLAWINDMDSQTGGNIIRWESANKSAVENFEKLFDGNAGSLTKEASDCFKELSKRKIGDAISDFEATQNMVIDLSNKIFTQKQKFENLVQSLENFPEKDKKSLEEGFAQIEPIREKLVKIASQWKKDKHEKLDHNKTTTNLKTVLDDATARLNTELAKPTPTSSYAAQVFQRIIQGLQAERDLANKSYLESKNKHSDLHDFSSEFIRIQGQLSALTAKALSISSEINPSLGTLDERIMQKMRAESFGDELDKKFVEQLEKNDQFEQLKSVSKGTKVEITYKKTAASSLRFPDQLNNTDTEEFIVIQSNEKGVILEKKAAGANPGKVITILGPIAKNGAAYKNAKVSKTSGSHTIPDPTVSGAWDSAIALNYKIGV